MTVTVELLFPHLDDLIQTPADVQRLNEAILQLAVQGKLVPQDPQDGPASELLKRIVAEKERLSNGSEISDKNRPKLITQDEKPYDIPESWEWVRVHEIGEVRLGRQRSPEHHFGDYMRPYLRAANVTWEGLDLTDVKEMNFQPGVFETYLLRRGDILLNEASGSASEVGKAAIWNDEIPGCCIQNTLIRVRLYTLWPDYIRLHFINDARTGRFGRNSQGIGINHLGAERLAKIPVALPPLAEQKRIVAKVDELFAQTRTLEAKLRRAQEAIVVVNRAVLHHLHHAADPATFQHAAQILGDHFDLLYTDPRPVTDLRQTILQLAVQGKLVPQDPHDEPAGELLKRVAVEKERLVKEKTLRNSEALLSVKEEEILFSVPIGWEWVKLGDLAFVTKLAGFEYTQYINLQEQGDIPVIRAQNVKTGFLDESNLLYIDTEISHKLERSALVNRSILMTFIGAGIGDVAIFDKDNRYHLAPNVAKIESYGELQDSFSCKYLLYYLMSPAGRLEIFKSLKATAQPSLSMKTIREVTISVPPLAEQKRIVAKVDELLGRCATLERKLGQAQVAGRQLTAAVLQGVVG